MEERRKEAGSYSAQIIDKNLKMKRIISLRRGKPFNLLLMLLVASIQVERVVGADGGWMDHLFGWLLGGIGDTGNEGRGAYDDNHKNLRSPLAAGSKLNNPPPTEEELGEMFDRLFELAGISTLTATSTNRDEKGERMFSLLNWDSAKQEGKRAMNCLAYLGGYPDGEDGAPKLPFMEGLYYRIGFSMFGDNPDNVDYICQIAQDYKTYGLLPEITQKGQLRFFPTKDQQRERRERVLQRERERCDGRERNRRRRRRLGTPTPVNLRTNSVLNPQWERVGANVRLQFLLENGADYGRPTNIERMVDHVYLPLFALQNLQVERTLEIMDAVCSGLGAFQFGFDPGALCGVIPGIIRSVNTMGDFAKENIRTIERVAIIHDRLIQHAEDDATKTDIQNLVTTLLP